MWLGLNSQSIHGADHTNNNISKDLPIKAMSHNSSNKIKIDIDTNAPQQTSLKLKNHQPIERRRGGRRLEYLTVLADLRRPDTGHRRGTCGTSTRRSGATGEGRRGAWRGRWRGAGRGAERRPWGRGPCAPTASPRATYWAIWRPLRFYPAEGPVGGFGGEKGEDSGWNDALTATATSEVTLRTFGSMKNCIDLEILIVPKK